MDKENKLPGIGGKTPQVPDIEQGMLGSALMDPHSLDTIFESVREDYFYDNRNRSIFRAIRDLHIEREPVNQVTVEEKLKEKGEWADHLRIYITDLTRQSYPKQNIPYYGQILAESSLRRKIIGVCIKAVDRASKEQFDVYDVLDELQENVFNWGRPEDGRTEHIVDIMNRVAGQIMQAVERGGEPSGILTGLHIDRVLGGFEDGKFYVLAARPSMGKTALALNIMRNIARNKDLGAGILSLETSSDSLGYRLISIVSGISGDKMRTGRLDEEEAGRVLDAAAELSEYGIIIDDTLTITDLQFRAKCRELVEKEGVSMILVDYLQLMHAPNAGGREREVAQISRMCKIVAKECGIPVVALAQLNRSVEQRNDKRPMLSDLRDSGSIEQDADAVLFLYRDEYYGNDVDDEGRSTKNICEVIIAKNKDGRTGHVRQYFDREKMRFANIDTAYEKASVGR